MHTFHFACMTESIKKYKKLCPMDRQNVMNCIHEGVVKKLPDPPPEKQVIQEIEQGTEFEDTPCYVCLVSTRDGY